MHHLRLGGRTRYAGVVILLLVALGIASDAAAQFGSSRRGTTGGDRTTRDAGQQRDSRPAQDNIDGLTHEIVEYRLAIFAEALRLTQEQQPLWLEFQKKVRQYAADVARQRAARTAPVSLSAAQPGAQKHLAQVVDDARNRLAAVEDVEAAANALMQVLAPDQRAAADMRIPTIVAPRPLPAGTAETPTPSRGSTPTR